MLQGLDEITRILAGQKGADDQGVHAFRIRGQGLLGEFQRLVAVFALEGLEGEFLGHFLGIVLQRLQAPVVESGRYHLPHLVAEFVLGIESFLLHAAPGFPHETFDEEGGIGNVLLVGHVHPVLGRQVRQ